MVDPQTLSYEERKVAARRKMAEKLFEQKARQMEKERLEKEQTKIKASATALLPQVVSPPQTAVSSPQMIISPSSMSASASPLASPGLGALEVHRPVIGVSLRPLVPEQQQQQSKKRNRSLSPRENERLLRPHAPAPPSVFKREPEIPPSDITHNERRPFWPQRTVATQQRCELGDRRPQPQARLTQHERRHSTTVSSPVIPGPSQPSARGCASQPAATQEMPKWYTKISFRTMQTAGTGRNVDARLEQIKSLIQQCKDREISFKQQKDLFDKIREELHFLAFFQVNEIALRRKQMLHPNTGLRQLFEGSESDSIGFPWDIQADATELYTRWANRIFSVDLLRGIVKRPSSKNSRISDKIDPAYPGKASANYYGEGDLVNGQWWPTQLTTVRDGAHGSTQGGIYANKDQPAYSIILSGGTHYKDRDEGTEIWYSGTDGKEGKMSENTLSMTLNVSQKKPVRVIRSHNMGMGKSNYRPERGFRYDGLYDVIGYDLLDKSNMACLFYLKRQDGQMPIRYRGIEGRPTRHEIFEYDKIIDILEDETGLG
ncbi:uncharacterized protein K452DRAFT_289244 [Aplosporella prunicola CBS 121167]|uniref:YDG domain-containing protein n=1 Tax=Aplosporella prunicola CBS 121167 TaxID=1176127 RepID=A0A6A6B968_9PEZI|nr:uncharacterized protein K452DRAFT_289244 [Aplosporella prunicola CBS 121167]KAF2139865.1 hypothetical protein K452DRAFT_289244 [Aplosporella prunicola CBS 121167]